VSPIYYRNSDCAIVCFERGGESSVHKWVNAVKANCSSCVFVVAATKSDLLTDEERIQLQTTVDQLAKDEIQAGYLTSAATGDDVKSVFGFVATLEDQLRQKAVVRPPVQQVDPSDDGPNAGCYGGSSPLCSQL
jgi:GTPase SAR1 family protein